MTLEVPEAGHRWSLRVKAIEFARYAGGKEKVALVVEDDNFLPGLGVGWTAELRPDNEGE
jgi:hypothetical protein